MPFRAMTEGIQENYVHFDFVVVGAGMSGLQFAKDVSRQVEASILILEAGDDLGMYHINWLDDEDDCTRLWQVPGLDPSFHRPWLSASSPHFDGLSGLRRRLGGRSLYWGGCIPRIEPWALCAPWWSERVIQDLVGGVGADVGLYEIQELEMAADAPTPGTKVLVEMLKGAGYSDARAMPLAIKYRTIENGDIRWAAYSPLDYWREAADSEGASSVRVLPRIACNSEVVQITTSPSGLTRLRVRNMRSGRLSEVWSSQVVLAAGTVENARLAMEGLWSTGVIDAPVLPGLMDHLITGFTCDLLPRSVPTEWLDPGLPSYALIQGSQVNPYNLIIRVTKSKIPGALFLDAWAVGEQMPRPENRVYLQSRPGEPPRACVSVGLSPGDSQLLEHMQFALRELYATSMRTLRPTLPPENLLYADMPLGTTEHESGCLALGTFVNEDGCLRGLPGVYPLGPCLFPRIGAANPSLTTLALAKRLAKLTTNTLSV